MNYIDIKEQTSKSINNIFGDIGLKPSKLPSDDLGFFLKVSLRKRNSIFQVLDILKTLT